MSCRPFGRFTQTRRPIVQIVTFIGPSQAARDAAIEVNVFVRMEGVQIENNASQRDHEEAPDHDLGNRLIKSLKNIPSTRSGE